MARGEIAMKLKQTKETPAHIVKESDDKEVRRSIILLVEP